MNDYQNIDYSRKEYFPASPTIEVNNKKYNMHMLLCFYVFDLEAKGEGKSFEEIAQMFEVIHGDCK